jgi:hypothetical protein
MKLKPVALGVALGSVWGSAFLHNIVSLSLIKRIPRCSASGWDNKKCVIARLDRAIQCLDLWIPRSSRRMTNVVFSITDTSQLCCSVIH